VLEAISKRYSWYRLTVFLAGGAITWLAASSFGVRSGWGASLISLLAFFTVVYFHNRLDRWIERFQYARAIKISQLARLLVDWDRVPIPTLPDNWERNALDIDLDLTGPHSLHHLLDTSLSHRGSQRLAKWLSIGLPDLKEINLRQKIVRELAGLSRFRDRLSLTFRIAAKNQLETENLLKWLEITYPSDRFRWLLPLASILTLGNIVLFILFSLNLLPALWIVTTTLILALYYSNVGMLNIFLESLVHLDTELGKFRTILHYLERYPLASNLHITKLCAPFRDEHNPPSAQLRKIKITTAAVGLRMNPIMGFVLNIILPWDFFFAKLAQHYRKSMTQKIPIWIDIWTELEALNSLANFSYLHPENVFPEIKDYTNKALYVRNMGHPLLPPEHKVTNHFKVQHLGQLSIITGSNMAGKSTFIKTIGINLCLAYAGGTVDATSCQTLPFRLHSCIRISDSIKDGFSYFYAEVKCLKYLLEKLMYDSSQPLLYLIDEIFRGTNNRERLIGSQAYVQKLVGARGTGLLATHDLELASLSEQSYFVQNFHFRDLVQDGKLVFDYKILPGPSPTTNALKIMEMEGLPTRPDLESK